MLNTLKSSRAWETAEPWLVYANKFSWIAHILLDWDNKIKLVPASFSRSLGFSWKKIKFSLQSVTVLTVITCLYCDKTS